MPDKVPQYQIRRKAKLCVRGCGRKAVKGRARCWRCARQQNAYLVAYRAKLKTAQAATPQ